MIIILQEFEIKENINLVISLRDGKMIYEIVTPEKTIDINNLTKEGLIEILEKSK